MKTFDKIKFDGVRVTIKYHEGAADDPQNETTYTSKDAPAPEFREALQALRADVIDICELPMQLYALDVRSVSFSHANDILGATITALYSLSKSNAPLVIDEPIAPREWDKKTTLNGKRILFVSGGGAGDAIMQTAIVGHAKRLYPESEWTVYCQQAFHGVAWFGNPNIEGMIPREVPVPVEVWNAHDYHMTTTGVLLEDSPHTRRNWFAVLGEEILGVAIPEEYARGEIYLHPSEEAQTWQTVFQTNIRPKHHIVVQLNTSKASRNTSVEFWITTLQKLQNEFPASLIFVFGEGEFAMRFATAFEKETWCAAQWPSGPDGKAMFGPAIFCSLANWTTGDAPSVIASRWRKRGDLGMGSTMPMRNLNLSLRAAAVIVRDALCVVAPDSAFIHLAASVGIEAPCVSLFGPFNPDWRVSTYPEHIPLYYPSACPIAPCAWHEDRFPADCPTPTVCAPIAAITPDNVIDSIKRLTE